MTAQHHTIEKCIKYTQIFENNITFHHLTLLAHQGNFFSDLLGIPLPERIKKSSIKRRNEFILGRLCAQYALKSLGFYNDYTLSKGSYGEPVWPSSIVGSISHSMSSKSSGVAIAYASNTTAQLVGVDIEIKDNNDIFFDKNIVLTHLFTTHELKYIDKIQHNFIYLIIFSTKESIIKAIFQKEKILLDFTSIQCTHINIEMQNIIFTLTKIKKPKTISANFLILENEIITYCIA